MSSPRHDHRDPARDKPGKRTVAYEAGSKAYPIIVESGTARKVAVDKSTAFGGPHPDAASFPNARLLESESTKGDDVDNVFTETFKSLPGPPITTTRLDDDGNAVTVTRQRVAVGSIVTAETLGGSPIVWTKKTKGEGDLVAAEQITETRAIPGNPMGPYGTEIDYDGKCVFTTKTRVVGTNSSGGSVVADGVWARTTHEEITELVMWEIIRTRTIPGDAVTTTKVDRESDQIYTETKTLKLLSDITEGVTKASDNSSSSVTESEPIDELVGYEIVTTFPKGDFYDAAHAIVETETDAYIFPTRVDVNAFILVFGVPLGLRKPRRAIVPHTIRTWWEISAPTPTLALDLIDYGEDVMYLPNGFSFGDCIHDAATIVYPGPVTKNFAATTPSYTTFAADWIGTDRVIKGSAKRDGNKYRWKVQQISVVME